MLQLFDPKLVGTAVEVLLRKGPQPLGETRPFHLRGHPESTREKPLPVPHLLTQIALEHLDLLFEIHLHHLPDSRMTFASPRDTIP